MNWRGGCALSQIDLYSRRPVTPISRLALCCHNVAPLVAQPHSWLCAVAFEPAFAFALAVVFEFVAAAFRRAPLIF
jgi:hypothetical protein